jgi:hypothetical protein
MERQKILNPLTGRMVYADGAVAKSIPKMKKSVGVLEGAVKRTLAKKPEPKKVYGWEDLPDDIKYKISGIVKKNKPKFNPGSVFQVNVYEARGTGDDGKEMYVMRVGDTFDDYSKAVNFFNREYADAKELFLYGRRMKYELRVKEKGKKSVSIKKRYNFK